jgi:hypothetical protein
MRPILQLVLAGVACLPAAAQIAPAPSAPPAGSRPELFARTNLIAWCVVPFDAKQRGPEARAEMLQRLGFRNFAYDWRDNHLLTWTCCG